MLVLATASDPRLLVSTFELDSADRGYTVDTLAHFQRGLDKMSDLFFIMGADSWSEITTWREWQRLLTMANHVVVTRPGYEIDAPNEELRERLIDIRSTQWEQEAVEERVSKALQKSGPGKIFVTDIVMEKVSATEVRRVASEGRYEELIKLVPAPVAEYIVKYGIYRKSNEAKLHSQRKVAESTD
jgi:nicotinate-nucleotide adenylyltransferase